MEVSKVSYNVYMLAALNDLNEKFMVLSHLKQVTCAEFESQVHIVQINDYNMLLVSKE